MSIRTALVALASVYITVALAACNADSATMTAASTAKESIVNPVSFVGRVTRAGVPVAGQTVQLDGRYSATTDADGYYFLNRILLSQVSGLNSGEHLFDLPSDGYHPRKLARHNDASLQVLHRDHAAGFIVAGTPTVLSAPPFSFLDAPQQPSDRQTRVSQVFAGNTIGQANQYGSNCGASSTSGPEAVYTLAIDRADNVSFDLTGSSFNPVLSLVDARTGMTLACADNATGTSHLDRILGQGVYLLVLDSPNSAGGEYSLTVTSDGAAAIARGAASMIGIGSTLALGGQAANTATAPVGCAPMQTSAAAFTLMILRRGHVALDTFGTVGDTALEIRRIGGDDAIVACNHHAPGTSQSQIDTLLEPGNYRLTVGKSNVSDGANFVLHAQGIDDCGGLDCYDVDFRLATRLAPTAIDAASTSAGIVEDANYNGIDDQVENYLGYVNGPTATYLPYSTYGCPAEPNFSNIPVVVQPAGPPPPPPNVVAWLADNPDLAGSVIWEDANAGVMPWANWTNGQRQDLQAAINIVWAWYYAGFTGPSSIPLTDPPQNVNIHGFSTYLSPSDAWQRYLAYLAQSLAIEMGGWMHWSLSSLDSTSLAQILDSRTFFHWDPQMRGFLVVVGAVTPAPPSVALNFLRDNHLLALSRCRTIALLLDWARFNMDHVYESGQVTSRDLALDFWQYAGFPPVSRVITGTTNSKNIFSHWTWGCSGTGGFVTSILRAVNIPVTRSAPNIGNHTVLNFVSEGLHVDHGDDPYNTEVMYMPYSTEQILINDATFDEWFTNAVIPNPNARNNVERRVCEITIDYLGPSLIEDYCRDTTHQLDHSNGNVLYHMTQCNADPIPNLLAYLEGRHLWDRLATKVAQRGGCPACTWTRCQLCVWAGTCAP